ncbi:hypothetical protein [Pseudoxanthomonas yeongjuensis]|uniref:hypothetical protein n=1 Tax=Pseudoxanthomonas yeongjuensis TaxID=377616 RepID=UPI00139114F2|nr:hypothetical protein [Pseudoxanthomonas yeongjuensis]
MSDEQPTRHQKALIAIKELTAPLSHVAAIAVGLTGIAYVLGWSYLRGHFKGLGAPWALQMLDATQYITAALGPLLTFALMLAISLNFYVDGNATQKGTIRFCGLIFAASAVCFAIHYSLEWWIFDNHKSHWNIAAFILLILAGFQLFIIFIVSIIEHFGPTTTTNMVGIGSLAAMVIASIAPTFAESRSKNKLDDMSFTPVDIKQQNEPCTWGLVHALSQERVLLISMPEGNSFRVVNTSEIDSISSSSSVACAKKRHSK